MFSLGCDIKQNLRDVKIHGLFTLLAGLGLHEARSVTLDLDLAACLLLDEFDVIATATDNLCAQVKAANGLETYRDLLFGPLALETVSNMFAELTRISYTTKFIALKVLRFTATEATLIYQIRQFLCQHLFDHLDSLVEPFLGCAGNAKIKGRVLKVISDAPGSNMSDAQVNVQQP